ncbi:threonylcarbamoyl-AMP synthase [Bacillus sp. BRMEA1]|uniref:L-threonylcarbamoyladenylate synthase n=1 Tax=Neobacillus endophyticus TaxID=2738405 RepID=UPI001563F01C|nr:L-threonylcarbamoyladenylate synthase [Neobacillus endophyticus]NRD77092.1 threonylcarbamoyl-AMP synthase [Neobacillus endophyticus]
MLLQKSNIKKPTFETIQEAAEIIRNGGVVITPTRTNYNVICSPTNKDAINKVFNIKKRNKFGPLTLALATPNWIKEYIEYPENCDQKLLNKVWPAELTLIFNKNYPFPSELTCGADTIGVMVQGNSILQDILIELGSPVACTSANISGQGDLHVDFEKAVNDLGELVDLVIEPEFMPNQLKKNGENMSTTIIDLTFNPPMLVRRGVIPVENMKEVFPNLIEDTDEYKQKLLERMN